MFIIALLASCAAAASTPWMLGDETTVACYTLDTQEDIPMPAGLDMQWLLPLPAALSSAEPFVAEYAVTVDDAVFWGEAGNTAQLGAERERWRRLCNASATANNTGCAGGDTASCCVFHANLHSCRQSTGSACEPWVAPRNATVGDDGTSSGCATGNTTTTAATPAPESQTQVLVTHTAALTGVPGAFAQPLRLPSGSWVTIAHVKIMNFQCAVGALRRSVDPEPAAAGGTDSAAVAGIAAGA
eukprot:CAMPEP_0174830358 /NCGR_PEP_ID=MMETSP1114-20130205/2476_1 /TAXON_ID=312471 /ORGANISM="Neobodo designis, Strain CCAP 1951/1" /LENGTH=242 /DNA_ID=CAMNT_0016064153 /DNA_START=301 /DNA_END=1025 /DNA_ORIENTATION=+